MKKIIAVLLAFGISIALCACGTSGDAQETMDNVNSTEASTEIETTENKEPKSIEITLENWDQYFEFKPYISTQENSFGEFQCIDRCGDGFRLKEEYVGRLAATPDIAVEVEFASFTIYRVDYNIVTKELIISNQNDVKFTDWDDLSNGTLSGYFGSYSLRKGVVKEDFKCFGDIVHFGNMCSPDEGYSEELGQNGRLNGDIYTFYAPLASEYKIVRIQGTLLINEE